MLDLLAPADPAQGVFHFRQPLGRHDQGDVISHGFRRAVAVQALRRLVPSGDRAVERHGDDGVVGGFDRGTEEMLAFGVAVARGFGAAMLGNLLLEREGFCIDLLDRIRERAREHTGLAAGLDGNGDLAVPGRSLNGFGQPDDRPGQRPRDQQRQHGRAQHGDRPDQQRSIPDDRGRRHDHGVGGGFDDAKPLGACQNGRRERYPARAVGLIRHDIRAALRRPNPRRQRREVGLPVVGLVEQPAEFAGTIGVDEIVTLAVDDIDRLARQCRRPHPVECPPHVDIDHENAEQFAVIGEDRRRDAERRPVRLLDQSVAAPQIELRNIDLSGGETDRILEIGSIAALLQSLFGNDPNRVVWSHAVDADNFAPVIIKADDAKHRVAGLGFQFRREAARDPVAPGLFGHAIDGIDTSRPAGADQAAQRHRRTEARDISGRAGRIIFEVGRDLPRMRLDAVAGAQQQCLLQVAIAQPADRGYRDGDQQDHRNGQSGGKRHLARCDVPLDPTQNRIQQMMPVRIRSRKQCFRLSLMTMNALRPQDKPQLSEEGRRA